MPHFHKFYSTKLKKFSQYTWQEKSASALNTQEAVKLNLCQSSRVSNCLSKEQFHKSPTC